MPHEPKRRHSRQRKGKRRASIKLAVKTGIKCPNCKNMMVSHTVCKKCGYYKGKSIIKIKEKSSEAGSRSAGKNNP
ncbi:MAG: 50S ribosomal protein L32 [Patescibacteria group bacterium]|nr:50S ribosomal protein L32 [Patescibacteria group bacterium]